MMVQTPTKYFFAKGFSEGQTRLNSFDNALIRAGVGDTNLIRLSSIVPPGCQQVEPIKLPGGALIPVAYSALTSDDPGTIISASVAIGIPKDDTLAGVIMEYSDKNRPDEVEAKTIQMVIDAFAFRDRELKEIKSIVISTEVVNIATVFAGIVLWY